MTGYELNDVLEDVLSYVRLMGYQVWYGETYVFVNLGIRMLSLYELKETYYIESVGNGRVYLSSKCSEEYKEMLMKEIERFING